MTKEELEAALQTMTQQATADHFGVHLATVKRAIKKHGIQFTKKSGGHYLYRDTPLDTSLELTPHQKDILTGCLLGDGFMLPTNIFRIKQSEKRREYVEYLHDVFSPFSTPVREDKGRKPTRVDGKVSHKAEHWNGEYVYAASFSTRQHPVFTETRKLWYPDEVKRLPDNLILNDTVLTHWYCQDGYNNKEKQYIRFSSNSFTRAENELLSQLLTDAGFINSVGKHDDKWVIYLIKSTGSYQKMWNLMKTHVVWKCFDYKI
jgi:hypothetical protein